MEFKSGDVVSIRHFSGTKLFKSIVLESSTDTLTIKLAEEIALLNCSDGDPVVLGFESNNEVFFSSCIILSLDRKCNQLVLKIESVQTTSNKRLFERFPVSLYADARIGFSQTKHLTIVKNISFNGLLVHSKTEFPLFQELKIDLDIGVKITLKVIVIRKEKSTYSNEYGLKIVYTDTSTPNLLKKYLFLLKREQEDFIKSFGTE